MVTEKELLQAIEELEDKSSHSYDACAKLATFYTILDKVYGDSQHTEPVSAYSAKPRIEVTTEEVVVDVGDSEFLEAVQGMNAQDAWLLMDELMETLKVVNPRLYSGVIRQLG